MFCLDGRGWQRWRNWERTWTGPFSGSWLPSEEAWAAEWHIRWLNSKKERGNPRHLEIGGAMIKEGNAVDFKFIKFASPTTKPVDDGTLYCWRRTLFLQESRSVFRPSLSRWDSLCLSLSAVFCPFSHFSDSPLSPSFTHSLHSKTYIPSQCVWLAI